MKKVTSIAINEHLHNTAKEEYGNFSNLVEQLIINWLEEKKITKPEQIDKEIKELQQQQKILEFKITKLTKKKEELTNKEFNEELKRKHLAGELE